eukprot:2921368-Rhodomonas_salina.3
MQAESASGAQKITPEVVVQSEEDKALHTAAGQAKTEPAKPADAESAAAGRAGTAEVSQTKQASGEGSTTGGRSQVAAATAHPDPSLRRPIARPSWVSAPPSHTLLNTVSVPVPAIALHAQADG